MNLVLAVQSCASGNEALKRHWPFFEKAGADEIIGIGCSDGKTWFPEGVRTELIGADLYIVGSHLCSRLIRTFEHMLLLKADWIAVAEYDVIFLKELPKKFPRGLTAHLAGGKMPDAFANRFFHNPWIADRETAMKIVRYGYELMATKLHDFSPDLFLGQITELAEIPVHTDILKSYSRNTIHGDAWTSEAREARLDGAYAIHGVKEKAVLEEIMR